MHPDFIYEFFDAVQRRQFLAAHCPASVVDAYDFLVPGAFKADLFRYAYLYERGGCYIDCKMVAKKSLSRYIASRSESLVLCVDYERSNTLDRGYPVTSYLNAIMCAAPRSEIMLQMRTACVDNILSRQDYFSKAFHRSGFTEVLDMTGPTLLYRIAQPLIDPSQLRLKHVILNNDETIASNFQIVDIDSGELVLEKTCDLSGEPRSQPHYSILWREGCLFYKNVRHSDDWIFLVHPHVYNDAFNFKQVSGGSVQVERTQSQGWFLDLTLTIINRKTSLFAICHIGASPTSVANRAFDFDALS